jgi:hypothetical protein
MPLQGWDQVLLMFGAIYAACVVLLLFLRAHPILALVGGAFLTLPAFFLLGLILTALLGHH